MAVNLAPIGNDAPYMDDAGDPAVGFDLYTYVAGSSTPANTYTASDGLTANDNPMALNADGYPTTSSVQTQVWLTAGVSYKFELKDAGGTTVWTRDNIVGINDTTVTIDQWVTGPAPTFISATSFSLAGDQTSTFHVGRRVKTTNSGGTAYSTILTSVFGAITTITVVNDSTVIDSGLSAVSYGLLSATNKSVPPFNEVVAVGTISGSANAITGSATTTAQGYVTNQIYCLIPASTNTAATTLNINAIGAKNIFRNGTALVGGEIRANSPIMLQYDGTQLNLVGPSAIGAVQAEIAVGTGTSIAISNIPPWATSIDLNLEGVSTNGTSALLLQMGDAGGIESAGYVSGAQAAASLTESTAGFLITHAQVAAQFVHGKVNFSLKDAANFTWVSSGCSLLTANGVVVSAGSKSLSAALDRMLLTTVGGTEVFDAGTINITYR